MRQICILLLCFSWLARLYAADDFHVHFTQISTHQGLTQSTARALAEDDKGFIWAGTLGGLNRYDGYNIVAYKNWGTDFSSSEDYRVRNLLKDSRGYLWITNFTSEIFCFDPYSDSFLPIHTGPVAGEVLWQFNVYESSAGDIWLWGNNYNCRRVSFQQGEIQNNFYSTNGKITRFLFEDSRNNIWTGGDYGLYQMKGDVKDIFYSEQYQFVQAVELGGVIYFATRESVIVEYDLNRKIFREFQSENPENSFMGMASLGGNEILLATKDSGLVIFDRVSHRFYQPSWAADPGLKGTIEFITDDLGGVWIYNRTGYVWYYNPFGKQVRKVQLIPEDIIPVIDYERYNILVDTDGLIWITTYGNGVFCYDPRTEIFRNYTYSADQNSPASDYILSIIEDRLGNIWLGSEYGGIIKVVKSPYIYQMVLPEAAGSIGKNNNIKSVYLDRYDKCWLGTRNGTLYVYNSDFSKPEHTIRHINPYCMLQDDKNRLWVGTKRDGVHLFDAQTYQHLGSYRNIPGDHTSLTHNGVYDFLLDSQNRMWVATFGKGICLVEENEEGIRFRRFSFGETLEDNIRCLIEDNKGFMWLGTDNGLIRFMPNQLIDDPSAYTAFVGNSQSPTSLHAVNIKTILEDSQGRLWIGTSGGGISRYIEASGDSPEQFITYTQQDGLAGDFVTGIREDQSGYLWIGTESGISLFDPVNESFNVYRFSEKTYGNYFNDNANVYKPGGNMYWGTLEGLLLFNPDYYGADESFSPVTFTNFFIYDQKAEVGKKDSPLTRSVSYADQIRLRHHQNTFTIEFSNLSFSSLSRYSYMLDGYEKQWSPMSRDNRAVYKNLPPGKYTFLIKGTNRDGSWNEQVSSLGVVISPPWWRSVWAYLVYLILFVFATVVVYRLLIQFNRLHNNVRIEKELTNHKLRFFTNISHEFRTPLTIIRGVTENLTQDSALPDHTRKQIGVLERNSNLLGRLIDQLLEFRKLQNNVLTLDMEYIDIVSFSKYIYMGFTELADKKEIHYGFDCPRETYQMFIDRRKMDKVLYNLLSNAFKFTPNGGEIILRVNIDEAGKKCVFSVEDSGPGVPQEKRHLLFGRFIQTSFSYDGSGVGLSLIKEFIEAHKGRVWYSENMRIGHGSVFTVQISTDKRTYLGNNFIESGIVQPELPEPEESVPVEIDDSALSNYKMLIIDDNEEIRNFLTDEFSRYFLVEVAEDGDRGLQKAIDCNPDLILCDVMMPGIDGFEVTRRLREEFQTCHIPIILLTAHSSNEHQVEGIQSGADAYIIKPFSLEFLKARVFKLIEQREQLKKRFSTEYVVGGMLVTGTNKDKKFLDQINQIAEENLADSSFTVVKFGQLACQGRSVFYRKVKGITGLSPNDFIRVKRLQRAAELLIEGDFTISEIAYHVGFEDPFYFSKCFKTHYDCSPSKYRNEVLKKAQEPKN